MSLNKHQYFGLNSWARNYVANAVSKTIAGSIQRRLANLSASEPAVASLYAYTMPDGKVLTEFVQGSVWSSGLNYLVALKDENGVMVTLSLWSQTEYDDMKAQHRELAVGPILPIV